MPFYLYNVSNSQGQVLQGTLQAANTDAARMALTSAGYVVHEIREQGASTPVTVPAVSSPKPTAPRPFAAQTFTPPAGGVVRTPRPEVNSNVQVNNPAGPTAKPNEVKTKPGKDKDLFFLFTQLGSYFRAGMNPAQSLNDLALRTPERYRESLKYAAQVVGEGGRMSDAFEVFPYLYPPDVVGTIRAGEVAGFMPEAMEEIADKMQASHALKKKLFYFQFMFIAAFVATPLILGVIEGSLASIKDQDTAGGSLPVVGTVAKAVGVSLIRDLPITLIVVAVFWVFLRWWHSMRMRDFRHQLVARLPVIGGRATAESMARFTWAMTMISRGGMSPQNTFLLALQSVPNLAIRKRLHVEGQRMSEQDKLSTALRRTGVLPPEFGDIVQTGEVTGDIPRALESVHRATDADYRAKNETAAARSGIILYIILGVVILIISAVLLTKYYGGLIHTILGE